MPRAAQDKPYKTFIAGLITEATGLTYPENSLRDVDNCDIELRGTCRRRLGITQEPGGVVIGEGALAVTTYGNNTGGPLSANPSQSASTLLEDYTFADLTADWTFLNSANGGAFQFSTGVARLASTQGHYGAMQIDLGLQQYDTISIRVQADEISSNEAGLLIMIGTTSAGTGAGFALRDNGLYPVTTTTRIDSGTTYLPRLNTLNYESGGYIVILTYARIDTNQYLATIVTYRQSNNEIVDTRQYEIGASGDYLEFRCPSGQGHTATWQLSKILVGAGSNAEEGDTGTTVVPATDIAISRHIWPNPAGLDGRNWVVFQIGNQLFFRDHRQEAVSLEGSTVPATSASLSFDGAGSGFVYRVTAADAAQVRLQSAVGNGRIWFTSSAVIPFYAEYDQELDSIVLRPNGFQAAGDSEEAATGSRRIRDFNGVPDGYANEEEPASLTTAHLYNLLNQGWTEDRIDDYETALSRYPSNAQQWVLGKDPEDVFSPTLLEKQDFGNALAPRGRTIIDALLGSKDGQVHALAGVDSPIDFDGDNDELSLTGWSTVGFYAGRVWYAGDSNRRRPNGVYFSKTLSTPRDSGTFMQEQDPTSEHLSDLLATDGGVIYIPEADRIIKLVPYGVGILVMASNGIWMIHGGEGGFSATNFTVDKISATGCISSETVIETEQAVVFWADNGVQQLSLPDSGVIPVVNDVSATKIFTYYANIPLSARLRATGSFDSVTKKVIWFWSSTADTDFGNLYDRCLIYDTRTSAFTPYSFAVDLTVGFGVAGGFPRLTPTTPLSEQVVTLSNGEAVTNDALENLTILAPSTTPSTLQNSLKLIILDGTDEGLRLGEFSNRIFYDFLGFENANLVEGFFSSYLVTGDETLGDFQRNKQATYIHSFFQRTESGFIDDGTGVAIPQDPSDCRLVARWDWHNTATGNRWSDSQRAYRYRKPYTPTGFADTFDTGEEIVYTKLKVRGKGRALTLRYDSEDGKDFQLLGFSGAYTANGV